MASITDLGPRPSIASFKPETNNLRDITSESYQHLLRDLIASTTKNREYRQSILELLKTIELYQKDHSKLSEKLDSLWIKIQKLEMQKITLMTQRTYLEKQADHLLEEYCTLHSRL